MTKQTNQTERTVLGQQFWVMAQFQRYFTKLYDLINIIRFRIKNKQT